MWASVDWSSRLRNMTLDNIARTLSTLSPELQQRVEPAFARAASTETEPLLGATEQQPAALAARRATLAAQLAKGNAEVCVASTANGAYSSTTSSGAAILENKLDFCRTCGYRCLIHTRGEHATSRPAKWDKLLVLHDALRVCNVALYVDADVVFRQAFGLLPLTRSWLVASKDFVGVNSGVLLLRRSPQAHSLLRDAWRMSFFNRSFSAEQNAIRLVLRRPFVEKREKTDRVTVFENLVAFQYYASAFGARVAQDTNFTPPLYHAAGCTNSATMSRSGNETYRTRRCQEMLVHQLPGGRFRECPNVERHFRVASFAFNRHTQRGGATNLGRRWLIGRDLRIRYTDQKGTNKAGRWWDAHIGCGEYGCSDAGAKVRRPTVQERRRT